MNLFDKIYNLTYSPLLTPYNLIETLKLDNYISLNMKKNELGIISEITCRIDNDNITFIYEFDKNDYILNIYYYENGNKIYLFDRNESLQEHRDEYNKNDIAL